MSASLLDGDANYSDSDPVSDAVGIFETGLLSQFFGLEWLRQND